ncbi:uncharacterized protein LOC106073623 [Biomphalaria glabrata]|uniref:Uncharacterized protein LOC106073623 n=2 Tax=Biomphalaria glabrata TaxID=6526 RepID=A0A9W2YXN3_BIOGL|nr:uncharacterized protein LOC106073623 [Biomphalaria glabrata]
MWSYALISLVVVVNAALVKENIHGGECVCTNTAGVNARDAAGTSSHVTEVLASGTCAKINGGILTADGYTWYQLQYAGKLIWVAGNYLDVHDQQSCSGQCPAASRAMACALLEKANAGVLSLAHVHPSGVQDNAFAYNNIRDMCNGLKASRSHYSCSTCPTGTPGGTVCLTHDLLAYLTALVSKGHVIVNELAGACHTCGSRHYNGQAVDLHNDARSTEYLQTCTAMHGWGQNEGDHIHCQFYD